MSEKILKLLLLRFSLDNSINDNYLWNINA